MQTSVPVPSPQPPDWLRKNGQELFVIYPLGADFRRTNNNHSHICVSTGGAFREPGKASIFADLPHDMKLWQAEAIHRAFGLAIEAARNIEQRWQADDPAKAQALLPAMEKLVATAAAIHASPQQSHINVQPLPSPRGRTGRSTSR